jgi:hypothetical protein
MGPDRQTFYKEIVQRVKSNSELKANLAGKDFTSLGAYSKRAYPSFNSRDLEKKKEQFLTIDRF